MGPTFSNYCARKAVANWWQAHADLKAKGILRPARTAEPGES